METNSAKIDHVKVVIVEDDSFYGEILRKYVSQIAESLYPKEKSSVCHFLSAEDCINNLDLETHLFILDYNLSSEEGGQNMDGLELLKMIKKECPDARTIVVTYYGDYATINQFNMLGADRYIVKDEKTPFGIITAVRQLLKETATLNK